MLNGFTTLYIISLHSTDNKHSFIL